MDAKTRDEEARKSDKKESMGETIRRKVSDALTPDFVKKINKALNPKDDK